MDELLINGFVSEIVIIALEVVLWLPFILVDCRIVKKITELGFEGGNRIKYPIACVAMLVSGLILWCVLEFGLGIAVFASDIYTALVVVSALCGFGLALPVCDFVRYLVIKKRVINSLS